MQITEALNDVSKDDLSTLTNKVESATEELGKIISKNKIVNENKKEFLEHLINGIVQQFKDNDLTREEKLLKGLFNKVIKSRIEEDTKDEEGVLVAGYIRKRVEELVMLIYTYRYLKFNDIEKIFGQYGIKLDYEPIENHINYFAGINFKETVKQLVDGAVIIKKDIEKLKNNVEENIYNEIPATIKYNKDVNPVGVTKNTFKKFSLLNLLKKINIFKAQKKCQDMTKEAEILTKSNVIAVSIADNIVSDARGEITNEQK